MHALGAAAQQYSLLHGTAPAGYFLVGEGPVVGSKQTITDSDCPPANEPPEIDCGGPITIVAGQDRTAKVPDIRGLITVSDDHTPAAQLVITQKPAAGTSVRPGCHSIRVFVTDKNGATSRCHKSLIVKPPPVMIVVEGKSAAGQTVVCTSYVGLPQELTVPSITELNALGADAQSHYVVNGAPPPVISSSATARALGKSSKGLSQTSSFNRRLPFERVAGLPQSSGLNRWLRPCRIGIAS